MHCEYSLRLASRTQPYYNCIGGDSEALGSDPNNLFCANTDLRRQIALLL